MNVSTHEELQHNQQTLLVYMYYRVALSGVLLAMFLASITPNILGAKSSQLYYFACLSYFATSFVSPFIFPVSSLKNSRKRINLLLSIDVGAQLVLIHACDGVVSGLGYLLIITTAMINIFVRGQLAYTYTAFMSIVLIADNIYLHYGSEKTNQVLFTSGTLGVLLFATTISLQYFTEKIRRATADAAKQSRYIKNLQEIAQNIVTRMQTGVIVVDSELKIEMMNSSAKQMLDIPPKSQVYGEYLANYRELAPVLKSWEGILQKNEATILKVRPGFDIRVNVAHLETDGLPKNIFYLEDYASIKQYAQQLKLASLGRLAARIAHEIRNPLGALSHASQLLAESEALDKTEKRMTEIIQSNCSRVNQIIENTLALSRRKEPNLEQVDLAVWLPKFIRDSQFQLKESIQLEIQNDKLLTRFDLTHLQQILSNLIDNGLRHSTDKNEQAWVKIIAGNQAHDDRPFIEIQDNGPGISQDKLADIYEPFYTTSEKGSGLGLYISKELTEINHATLHYTRGADELTCFRLNFSHYQRTRLINE